ncbi:2-succinyl-5-enolpyruvyl-6-hydroxy-3-cyclohexene-1-carboxylic-acid synthase [Halobacteria archaeon AArc-dxtr1]|nr:2-succinyl-5-enolpyruvyl-6-hydroxy-3-cyclohexene-1-carboxylic-acid synthase [Halobacteria archaeon AArc-dxtr1]
MTPEVPNRATLWGRAIVDELAAGGLEAVCIAPGSRSTPLTVAFADHPDITVYSHIDERSAAFFALGRARRTGEPTAVVCTSGTAAANLHPAIVEANQGRVPLLALTADRPPELRDSGANQTVDQAKLYGDAVRWYAELPVPEPEARTLRSLRVSVARALSKTIGTPAGPVHLNCPFRKPLEPTPVSGDVPDSLLETVAARGRDGPFVRTSAGTATADEERVEAIATALETADRPLLVAGPADPTSIGNTPTDSSDYDALAAGPNATARLADAVGAPILADPLSACRFGPHVDRALVCGGYDGYVDALPKPDVVVRIGASPTSKRLREYLAASGARQFLLDPAGEWREATFTATDLCAAEPGPTLASLAERVETGGDVAASSERSSWLEAFETAEHVHWGQLDRALEGGDGDSFEGAILSRVFAEAPDPSTIFVSNSMPIRDADRFARPRQASLSALGNRGASGIDGIASTALGAGSATDEPLVLVTGDLAFCHDANGLLAVERCGVDATIVVLDNDGGGIFHMLPIEDHDPPFTEQFKTPHGINLASLAASYGLDCERVEPASFTDAYRTSLATPGTQVLVVEFDAETSHRRRERLADSVRSAIRDGTSQ